MKKMIISSFITIIFSLEIFPEPAYITLCKADEINILTFMTAENKTMSICAGKDFIIYRYGKKNSMEMEFPGDKRNSWSQFRYSFYIRGGGPENEGIDINYLKFKYRGADYTVYEEYSSADNKKLCGIKIRDRATGKETDIPALPATVTGSLAALREYDKIQSEE